MYYSIYFYFTILHNFYFPSYNIKTQHSFPFLNEFVFKHEPSKLTHVKQLVLIDINKFVLLFVNEYYSIYIFLKISASDDPIFNNKELMGEQSGLLKVIPDNRFPNINGL